MSIFVVLGSQSVPLTRLAARLALGFEFMRWSHDRKLTKQGPDTRRLGPKRRYKSTEGTRNN